MTTYPVTLKTVDAAGHRSTEHHQTKAGTFNAAVRAATVMLIKGRDLTGITTVTITVERPRKGK